MPDTNPLFHGDPNVRVELCCWVNHINERVVAHIYQYLESNRPGEYPDRPREALVEGMPALDVAVSPFGPFFCGTGQTAIDLVFP